MTRARVAIVGAVVLVAAAVAAVGIEAGWFRSERTLARDERISANAFISPRTHMFGDPVTARLDLVFSRIFVPVESVHVKAAFTPYVLGSSTRTRTDHGKTTRLTYVYRLTCLRQACLPADERTTKLPPAVVSYSIPGFGGPSHSNVNWPSVTVAARLGPADRERPEFRAVLRPLPAATYRIRPTVLAALSLAGALVLVLVAAALLVPALPRSLGLRRPSWLRRRTRPRTALEQALARLRAAAGANGAGDERRALEQLAVELAVSGETGLAGDARRLAWSPGRPGIEGVRDLEDEVERVIGEAR
jgi:hypothetical protein